MNNRRALLVVDDTVLHRDYLTAVFGNAFMLLFTSDGSEALKRVEVDNGSICCILCNPKTAEINSLVEHGIPVIAFSADKSQILQAIADRAVDAISADDVPALALLRVENAAKNYRFENSMCSTPVEVRSEAFEILNNVPCGIAIYEVRNSNVLTKFCNDGLCELTGRTRIERSLICRDNALALVYDDDLPIVREAVDKAVETHENIDITFRLKTKCGKPRYVVMHGVFVRNSNGLPEFRSIFTDIDELKQVERRYLETQKRYAVAINCAGIKLWEYDIENDTLATTDDSLRFPSERIKIEHFKDKTVNGGLIRSDSVKRYLNIFERLRNGEADVSDEVWIKMPGQNDWCCERIMFMTYFDDNGKPLKAFGTSRDITREKEVEKKYNEEASLCTAMQSTTLSALTVNLTNNTVQHGRSSFDAVSELIKKCTVDELFEQTLVYIVGKENKKKFREAFSRRALVGKYNSGEYSLTYEFTRFYDDSRIYWVKYSVRFLSDLITGDTIAYIVANDITPEKMSLSIMESITKSDYDFIVVVDGVTNTAREYGASGADPMFHPDDMFDRKIEEFLRARVCAEDLDRTLAACRTSTILSNIEDSSVYKFNFSVIEPSGEIRRKQMQMSLIDRARMCFLLTQIDVTSIFREQRESRRKLEDALLAAEQASQVKSDFLARMSHDIRTPMNAIIGMIKLAQDEDNPSATAEYLENMDTSSHFLLGLINDILDLSKIESGGLELKPEPYPEIEFDRGINTVIRPLMEAKHIDFRFEMLCGANCIVADKLRFNQIFFNLLSNAAKFTPENGMVVFSAEHIPSRGNKHGMRFRIRDNGIGMSEEFQQHMYEPFSQENTASGEGTGLGLSIVKHIVEAMDGNISVASAPGCGTEFVVDLYAEVVKGGTSDLNDDIEKNDMLDLTVLLTEDNELNIVVAKRLLERKGCKVDIASNGQIAVEKFSKSPIEYYDAVLMDIRMPVMSGLEATGRIRALPRPDATTVPIIAMTADAFSDDRNRTIEAGMNAHITKPIDPDIMYGTIAQLTKK